MIKKFVKQIKSEETMDTSYDAGRVYAIQNEYHITNQQKGAEDTFSVGQPVYDTDLNLMGYLGVGLLGGLDYAAEIRIPCDSWVILLPTQYCKAGKKVLTYWQYKERLAESEGKE